MAADHIDYEERYNLIDGSLGINLLFAGRERNLPTNRVSTTRDHFLFHFVTGGQGILRANNQIHHLAVDQGFFIFPGQTAFYSPAANDPWSYWWMGFSGRESGALLEQLGITGRNCIVTPAHPERLKQFFETLLATLRLRPTGFPLAAMGYYYLIMSELGTVSGLTGGTTRRTASAGSDAVQAATEFIDTNLQRGIGAAETASYVGLDAGYLNRLFKARHGCTMREYLIRSRLERAKLLLKNSTLTVAHIAQSVGYADYPTFEKRFKAIVGRSPSDYRSRPFF